MFSPFAMDCVNEWNYFEFYQWKWMYFSELIVNYWLFEYSTSDKLTDITKFLVKAY